MTVIFKRRYSRGSSNSHEEDGPQASAVLPHLRDGHRAPRDGKVLEELGYYDPMVTDTDARALLNGERIAYWLRVGAQPSDKVRRADQEVRHERHARRRSSSAALERLKIDPPAGSRSVHSAAEAAGTGAGCRSAAPTEAAGEPAAEATEGAEAARAT